MKYKVLVIEYHTSETVKEIDCGTSESKADRVAAGLNINLDHSRFYTIINAEEE